MAETGIMRRDEVWTVIGGASLAVLLWLGVLALILFEPPDSRFALVAIAVVATALIAPLTKTVLGRLHRQEAAESRLRAAIDFMPDGLILFDAEGRLVTWNKRYEALFPFARPILRPGIRFADLAQYVAHFITGSDDDATRAAWARWRIERHAASEPVVTKLLADGRVLETTDRRTAEGGIVSLTRDVTAFKSDRQALLEAEARFSDFAGIASDWFWETDARHNFTFVSARADRAMLSPGELGRLDELAEGSPALQAALAAQSPFANQPMSVRHISGEAHWVVAGRPMRDAEGRFLGYRGCSRSLTARLAADLALRASVIAEQRHAQAALLADMAERIRVPASLAPEAQAAALAALADKAQELAALERGEVVLARGWFEIGTVIAEIIAMLQPAAGPKQIAFEVHHVTGPVPLLWGDGGRLRRVLGLLADNAVRHTEHGTVAFVIGLEQHEGAGCTLCVEVHDEGSGIPSAVQARLFESAGGGFGLKIFRLLVQLMAGKFGMTSEVGVGSTFWFRLPLEAEKPTAA